MFPGNWGPKFSNPLAMHTPVLGVRKHADVGDSELSMKSSHDEPTAARVADSHIKHDGTHSGRIERTAMLVADRFS